MINDSYEPRDVIEYCLLTNWTKTKPDHLNFDSKNLKECMIYLKTSKFRKSIALSLNKWYIDDPNLLSQLSISKTLFDLLTEESNDTNDDKKYLCFICGDKTFFNILSHLKLQHKMTKDLIKDYFKMYKNDYEAIGYSLEAFDDATHARCDICKKKFLKIYYKKHLYVHFDLRFVICPICGKSRSKFNLKGHIQRAHVRPGGLIRDR
ncbi:unnamed protein product [Blepharisma stoltei]|uniref:C2H2-type domain-containing protein n=1 Tax=Blepharisma stoltei TaxID=1481888 RepID=A0AAU9I6X5_9CILI|nr:unnamed protein product [Blepharisma stoltei]